MVFPSGLVRSRDLSFSPSISVMVLRVLTETETTDRWFRVIEASFA